MVGQLLNAALARPGIRMAQIAGTFNALACPHNVQRSPAAAQHPTSRRLVQRVLDRHLFELFQQDSSALANGSARLRHSPEKFRVMFESVFEPILV